MKHSLSVALRAAERLSPVWMLYGFGYPRAWHVSRHLPEQTPGDWPECLGGKGAAPAALRLSADHCINGLLHHLKDRLIHPRWRIRCKITGLEHLKEARRHGPVLLAFVHFGAYSEGNLWLRAHGIPATTLMIGAPGIRPALRRHADRYCLFPPVPYLLHVNQLRELVQVVASGGVVMIALDVLNVRQKMDIPIDETGEVFHMAAGALRLAAKHGASLLSCNIIEQGRWRFLIELGEPVPSEYLAGTPDFLAAGRHLLAQMLPCWRRHPDQCHGMLLECIRPALAPR